MIPEELPRETTDPNPVGEAAAAPALSPISRFFKWAAERATSLQVVAGFLAVVFALGVSAKSATADLATKADLEAAMRAHVATPHGPDVVKRLDEIERWRAAHEAAHAADTWWIKQSLGALLQRQGLRPPADRPPELPPARDASAPVP